MFVKVAVLNQRKLLGCVAALSVVKNAQTATYLKRHVVAFKYLAEKLQD
jgi:hypothetical protein